MGKSNLLKEAIADAKAVRETALANARMRMEEAFTPRLQSMISAKLQNEIEGEDEEGEENFESPEVDVDAEPESEVDIDVPEDGTQETADDTGEAEDLGGDEESAESPVEVEAEPDSNVDVEVEPDVEGDEDGTENVEDAENTEDDSDDLEEEGYELDLESIIKELDDEADMEDDIEEPELQESEDTDEGMKDDQDVTPDLTGETGPNPNVTQDSPDRGKPFNVKKDELKPAATLKQNPKNAIYEDDDEEIFVDDDENGDMDNDDEINIDEILRELEEEDLSASMNPELVPGESNPFKQYNEQLKVKVSSLSKNLKEHRQVIKFLKSKLNEVNLLNAKLLFTSKLFKSNNMSNTEKMKIIESFDRAKTLREVKLVYSTIAESVSVKSKTSSSKSVKKITENIGGASKTVTTTKPSTKKVISEGIVSEDGAERIKYLVNYNSRAK